MSNGTAFNPEVSLPESIDNLSALLTCPAKALLQLDNPYGLHRQANSQIRGGLMYCKGHISLAERTHSRVNCI